MVQVPHLRRLHAVRHAACVRSTSQVLSTPTYHISQPRTRVLRLLPQALRRSYGNVAALVEVYITHWAADPSTCGSFSRRSDFAVV